MALASANKEELAAMRAERNKLAMQFEKLKTESNKVADFSKTSFCDPLSAVSRPGGCTKFSSPAFFRGLLDLRTVAPPSWRC